MLKSKDKKRILIVDDEVALCRILKANLESSGEYSVRTESKEANVLRVVHIFKPDLIIMDVMMPNKDGTELAYQLSEDKYKKYIPILFFSAIASEDETKRCFGHIVEDWHFLSKPAGTEKIIETIEEILKKNR